MIKINKLERVIMKKFKEYGLMFVCAIVLAVIIRSFILTSATVSAQTLSNYQPNDKLLVYHLVSDYKLGDNIMFKVNNTNYIRKISNINDNQITITDKNNKTQIINKKDIIGKVIFKY
jgi:hypothetical protein